MSRLKHPPGLMFLIVYKAISGLVLFGVSIALLMAWRRYDDIADFALEPHRAVVTLTLNQFLKAPPKSLEFGALATLLYATIAGVESIGLWFEKSWARWLVLLSVGLSIPIEIYELYHHMTGIKWLLFVINLVVFWYVLRRFPSHHHGHSKK
jgi:uncharacterized membrane protein (DUF2068 family)